MSSKPAIRFRPLRIADYAQIHALWKKTEGIGLGESDDRAGIAQFIARNPDLSLVATSRGRIVATVLCGHDGRRGYLHHLAVDRRWRHQGIGRALVTASLEKLSAAGIPKCNLFLFASNTEGRAFWKRLGWVVRTDLRLVQRGTANASPCGGRTC